MFPYDAELAAAVKTPPESISGALGLMRLIDGRCAENDGLKWFNWLYLQVTQAVEEKVNAGGYNDPAWLAELDVKFAALYFSSLYASLSGAACPGCWSAMLSARDQTRIARIQFALAGMNAHINRDLPIAIVSTCQAAGAAPQHGTPHYSDYTAINSTLNGLLDLAKKTLNVRLLGDPLPPVSHLEDTIAALDLAAFREKAWDTAENLWQASPLESAGLLGVIDTLTAGIGKALLVPVP
ncbi:MAG TPA: DUF5995 family protein [Bryobacteraceae bacterium]|jgi:hypothetical protein